MTYVVGLFAILVVLMFVPGLVVGVAGGLRGWLLVGVAPLLTYGVVALGGPVVPSILGRWSLGTFALTTLVVAVVVFGVRLVSRRWTGTLRVSDGDLPRWQPWQHAGTAGVVLLTAAIGVTVIGRASGGYTDVHQFWDAIFHANAVRYIADTGQSAPGALRVINDPTSTNFYYPNAFHVLMATAHQLLSGSISTLLNVQAGLVAGIFALGLVTFIRVMGGRPLLAVAVGFAAAGFSSFPYDMAFFGPLWPFATGIALLPAFMALFVQMMKVRHPALVPLAVLGISGLVLLHSSIAVTAAIFAVCYLVQRWFVARRIPLRDVVVLGSFSVLAAIYALPQLLAAVGTAGINSYTHPFYAYPADALGELVFLSHESSTPQAFLVAAMLLGLVRLRQLGNLGWWLAGGVVFAGLFIISTSFKGPIYQTLTGMWWDDKWRFAALVVPAMVVLAGHGLVVGRDLLFRLGRTVPDAVSPRARVAVAAVVLLLLAGLTHGLYQSRNVVRVANAYHNGPTVSDSELQAMSQLPKLVHPGDLVMNDSGDGSAWMWALDEVQPVFGASFGVAPDPASAGADRRALYLQFNQIDDNQQIQAAVKRLKITYVYVGAGFVAPDVQRAPGLTDLNRVRSLVLVYSDADAQIYRVNLGVRLTAGSGN